MALALVQRELLSEARRPAHYWLRIVPVCLGVLSIMGAMAGHDFKGAALGPALFGALNQVVFISAWLLVPLITADCISRERREGTLGLLFLTPLSAWGVVIGKVLAQAVRVVTVGGAMVPVLALPLLAGGVAWERVATAAMLDAAAVLMALGCGVLASAFARERVRALVLAGLLGFGFGSVFVHSYTRQVLWEFYRGMNTGGVMWGNFQNFAMNTELYALHLGWGQSTLRAFLFAGRADTGGLVGFLPGPMVVPTGLRSAAQMLAGGCVGIAAAVLTAGWRVRRLRNGEEQTAAEAFLVEIFCSPVFLRDRLRRRMSRALDRNPIGWLQSYTWSARLTKWGWCLVILLVELMMVSDVTLRSFVRGHVWLVEFLMLSLSFSAASSFRRERETGALELLLVTPLREEQVIEGRVRGIWSQFLPAVVLMGLAMLFIRFELHDWYQRQRAPISYASGWWLCLGFICLPMVGLYFSIKAINPVVGWLATFYLGFVLPYTVVQSFGPFLAEVAGTLWMFTVAWLLHWRLVQDLRARRFVLQTA